uniref:Uncharacterized protein n=1 Tax=Anguilla anguilla TaxID=7936 RepID=A0A0E9UBP9_ANGAN
MHLLFFFRSYKHLCILSWVCSL